MLSSQTQSHRTTNKQTSAKHFFLFARACDPTPLWVQYPRVIRCSASDTQTRGFNFLMCTQPFLSTLYLIGSSTNRKRRRYSTANKTRARSRLVCFVFVFVFLFFFPTALPLSSSGQPLIVLAPGLNHDPTEEWKQRETHSSTVHLLHRALRA